jgi:hypothetical protein
LATFNFNLDTGGNDESPNAVRIRRAVGTRDIFDNSGVNGIFTRGPSRITGSRKVYMDFDVSRKVIAAIQSMGAMARQGCANAANNAAKQTAAKLIGIARRDMNTSASEATKATKVTATATESRPAARVTVREIPIPLIRFGARETDTGVTAIGDRRARPISVTNGFIADGRRGRSAFVRETSRRYPLDELFGPSVRNVIADRMPQLQDWIKLNLFRELQNETDRIINFNFGFDTLGVLDAIASRT